MRHAFKTFFVHITVIIIFAMLYYIFSDNYYKTGEKFGAIDYILLSTTIQAGVGISDIHPSSFPGKLLLIIQQLLMIMTHIFTIYFFTL
jgi:hypothetical protein